MIVDWIEQRLEARGTTEYVQPSWAVERHNHSHADSVLPPHRDTLLEPVSPQQVRANPNKYRGVVNELTRGLRMITGLDVLTDAAPGWIGLVCSDTAMAL